MLFQNDLVDTQDPTTWLNHTDDNRHCLWKGLARNCLVLDPAVGVWGGQLRSSPWAYWRFSVVITGIKGHQGCAIMHLQDWAAKVFEMRWKGQLWSSYGKTSSVTLVPSYDTCVTVSWSRSQPVELSKPAQWLTECLPAWLPGQARCQLSLKCKKIFSNQVLHILEGNFLNNLCLQNQEKWFFPPELSVCCKVLQDHGKQTMAKE